MDTKCIYDYFNELSKCDWHDNAIVNGIKYNGVEYSQGTWYYQDKLSTLHDNAEQMLLELSAEGKTQIIQALYNKAVEICTQPYDVISMEDVEALKRDTIGNTSRSVKSEIELGYFVVQMHGIQRYFQHKLVNFIKPLLGIDGYEKNNTEPESVAPTNASKEEMQKNKDERLICGVKGLAEYLGCGITKAQEIFNSGILQEKAIAYRNGKSWRINSEKLENLLTENPEIFKRLPK